MTKLVMSAEDLAKFADYVLSDKPTGLLGIIRSSVPVALRTHGKTWPVEAIYESGNNIRSITGKVSEKEYHLSDAVLTIDGTEYTVGLDKCQLLLGCFHANQNRQLGLFVDNYEGAKWSATLTDEKSVPILVSYDVAVYVEGTNDLDMDATFNKIREVVLPKPEKPEPQKAGIGRARR